MEKITRPSISTRIGFDPRQSPPATDVKSRRSAPRRKSDDGRSLAFPRLSDPEDVAARIAESWNRDFADQGGTRSEFAAGARARLRRWARDMNGKGLPMTFEERFRSEVAGKVSARLEAWIGSEASKSSETPGGAPLSC